MTLKKLIKMIVALNVKKHFVVIARAICMMPRKKECANIVMKVAVKYALVI